MTQETTERTFSVPSPARLTVSNVRGAVTIAPGEPGRIAVTAVKHTHTGNADRTRLELEQSADGSVTIAARFDSDFMFFFLNRQPCRVDFTIRVPPSASVVHVGGVSSSVEMSGLSGEFDVHTVSGDVILRDLAGMLKLNSVSGGVRGERLALSAPLDVETVSGEVHLRECNLPAARGRTVSGDVMLQTPLGDGPYHFSSVSGEIGLWVPAGTACEMALHSLSGDVATDLPVTSRSRSPGRARLDVNGGGAEVRVHSVSGGLSLMSALGETAPNDPAPISRQEILERIERGELSVEDALRVLS
jgi:hypothetical protein